MSFELAMSFAQNGMKTLLIDADTRKSVMKNRGKKGKIKYGLTHYLSGKNELKDVICVSDVPNFCINKQCLHTILYKRHSKLKRYCTLSLTWCTACYKYYLIIITREFYVVLNIL